MVLFLICLPELLRKGVETSQLERKHARTGTYGAAEGAWDGPERGDAASSAPASSNSSSCSSSSTSSPSPPAPAPPPSHAESTSAAEPPSLCVNASGAARRRARCARDPSCASDALRASPARGPASLPSSVSVAACGGGADPPALAGGSGLSVRLLSTDAIFFTNAFTSDLHLPGPALANQVSRSKSKSS